MCHVTPGGIVLALLGVFIVPPAFARVVVNTIDPLATVIDGGRHVIVTGVIGCTEGQSAYVRVTVTQRPTGAVAGGHTRITCTGDTQHWQIDAAIQVRNAFAEGHATAVALARTTDHGVTDDAHQWLVDITLVGSSTQ